MAIHISSTIQRSLTFNQPSQSLCEPTVVILFPDLLKNIQGIPHHVEKTSLKNSLKLQAGMSGGNSTFSFTRLRPWNESIFSKRVSVVTLLVLLNHKS